MSPDFTKERPSCLHAEFWHTPTVEVDALSTSRAAAIRTSDEIALVSPGMRDFFESGFYHGLDDATASRELTNHLAILSEVRAAGGNVLIGTDAGFGWILPGYSIHDELGHFVDGGFPPYEALAAATVRASASVGQSHEWGRIAPGLRADLILVNADPLHSVGAVSHSSGVMVRGHWLSRGTLEGMLDDIRASYGG